ncbi:MAG: hypothetical protein ACOC56_05355 [Atribacterota bacterium]
MNWKKFNQVVWSLNLVLLALIMSCLNLMMYLEYGQLNNGSISNLIFFIIFFTIILGLAWYGMFKRLERKNKYHT